VPEIDFEVRFAADGPITELLMQFGRAWPSVPIPKVA
jgi:hypothetical protein